MCIQRMVGGNERRLEGLNVTRWAEYCCQLSPSLCTSCVCSHYKQIKPLLDYHNRITEFGVDMSTVCYARFRKIKEMYWLLVKHTRLLRQHFKTAKFRSCRVALPFTLYNWISCSFNFYITQLLGHKNQFSLPNNISSQKQK